jgi:AcrR family transcriptional regulator
VAAEAGVALGTVYRYVPDLQNLLVAAAEQVEGRFVDALRHAAPDGEPLVPAVPRIAAVLVEEARREPRLAELLALPRGPDAVSDGAAIRCWIADRVAASMASGEIPEGNRGMVAAAGYGLVRGVFEHALTGGAGWGWRDDRPDHRPARPARWGGRVAAAEPVTRAGPGVDPERDRRAGDRAAGRAAPGTTSPSRSATCCRARGTPPDGSGRGRCRPVPAGPPRDRAPWRRGAGVRRRREAPVSQPFGGGLGPLEELVGGLLRTFEQSLTDDRDDRDRDDPGGGPAAPRPAPPRPRARTPRLDRYGRDLTDAARRGLLDPVIGREDEVDQVLEVLGRRTKNNPVLVGDPGVGKTAIVEGIAQRVVEGRVPPALRGVRVVALDLAGMVAGTRYRGDFEARITAVVDEVVAARRSVVLFVDEVHAVVGAGSAEGGALDAATILKPALARGDLQLIGATTVEDHRRHISRDPALERRFEPVRVAEPTVEQTVAVLRGSASATSATTT